VYRSTADIVADTNAGLAGFLVVGRPGSLAGDGRPQDVDREVFYLLQVSTREGGWGGGEAGAGAPGVAWG
jgi:hypothetical protein